MAKKFSQFIEEAYVKSLNEQEILDLVSEMAEDLDLTEEETQEVLDELSEGLLNRIKTWATNVKTKMVAPVAGYLSKRKIKSRAGDISDARGLRVAKEKYKAKFDKASGREDRAQARSIRQANIRTKKAGGSVDPITNRAYLTHPTTGKKIGISNADAAAIGRGEKKASDVIKAKTKPAAPVVKPTKKPVAKPKARR